MDERQVEQMFAPGMAADSMSSVLFKCQCQQPDSRKLWHELSRTVERIPLPGHGTHQSALS